MKTKETNCQNCEKPLEEGFEFCPNCGQKTNENLTIGILFYNTISNYFSFDARFLKSFIPLIFRPGYLAKKFLDGKRLLYLHPAQMYLFVSVIFFFILSFSTREFVIEADKLNEKVVKSESIFTEKDSINKVKRDSTKIDNSLRLLDNNKVLLGLKDEDLKTADSIIKLNKNTSKKTATVFGYNLIKMDSLIVAGYDDVAIAKELGVSEETNWFKNKVFNTSLQLAKGSGAGKIVQSIFDTIPISMFFLLPLFAFILKIFYFKKGSYAHHLVFSFYFFSFLFTVFSILIGVNRFLYDIPDWIDWLFAFSTYLYFLMALINFYRQNWFLTLFKSGIISFVFLLMVLPLAFLLVLSFAFLNS